MTKKVRGFRCHTHPVKMRKVSFFPATLSRLFYLRVSCCERRTRKPYLVLFKETSGVELREPLGVNIRGSACDATTGSVQNWQMSTFCTLSRSLNVATLTFLMIYQNQRGKSLIHTNCDWSWNDPIRRLPVAVKLPTCAPQGETKASDQEKCFWLSITLFKLTFFSYCWCESLAFWQDLLGLFVASSIYQRLLFRWVIVGDINHDG